MAQKRVFSFKNKWGKNESKCAQNDDADGWKLFED